MFADCADVDDDFIDTLVEKNQHIESLSTSRCYGIPLSSYLKLSSRSDQSLVVAPSISRTFWSLSPSVIMSHFHPTSKVIHVLWFTFILWKSFLWTIPSCNYCFSPTLRYLNVFGLFEEELEELEELKDRLQGRTIGLLKHVCIIKLFRCRDK